MKWSTPTKWGTMGYALPEAVREVRTLGTPQPLPTLEPNLSGGSHLWVFSQSPPPARRAIERHGEFLGLPRRATQKDEGRDSHCQSADHLRDLRGRVRMVPS